MRLSVSALLAFAAVLMAPSGSALAQPAEPGRGSAAPRELIASEWSILITSNVRGNIEYAKGPGWTNSLDVFWPDGDGPFPVVVYYHGGGWSQGAKEDGRLFALPFLDMGFAIVNVGYRLAGTASAPAAAEDAICAARWVAANAPKYRLDPSRMVLAGHSAGGHLALMAGLAQDNTTLAKNCSDMTAPRIAAVINYSGVTDVADLLEGSQRRPYATNWIGNQTEGGELAALVSPINHVHRGAPSVLTVHGDQDEVVPYAQAVRLHEKLQAMGVPNRLVSVREGGHAFYDRDKTLNAHAAIELFLMDRGLLKSRD